MEKIQRLFRQNIEVWVTTDKVNLNSQQVKQIHLNINSDCR